MGKAKGVCLFVFVGYAVSVALEKAKLDGIDWLLHLDPDELFYTRRPALDIRSGEYPAISPLDASLSIRPSHRASQNYQNRIGLSQRCSTAHLYVWAKKVLSPCCIWVMQ